MKCTDRYQRKQSTYIMVLLYITIIFAFCKCELKVHFKCEFYAITSIVHSLCTHWSLTGP